VHLLPLRFLHLLRVLLLAVLLALLLLSSAGCQSRNILYDQLCAAWLFSFPYSVQLQITAADTTSRQAAVLHWMLHR
jgi:hypothetical protein